MALRDFSGNAKTTSLSGAISASATSITVASATGYPTGSVAPFVITIDPGLASEEKVLVTSRTGNTFTVASRGWDGTTAADHGNAAAVMHTFSATDAREANAHVNDSSGNPHAQYLLTTDKAADSELLDGFNSSTSAVASTVAVRTTSGRLVVGTPTGTTDATTKAYVDAADALKLNATAKAADSALLNGFADTSAATADTIARRDAGGRLSVVTPTATGHAATKGYVDGLVAGVTVKGTYTGDGTTPSGLSPRTISLAFTPKMVFISSAVGHFAQSPAGPTTDRSPYNDIAGGTLKVGTNPLTVPITTTNGFEVAGSSGNGLNISGQLYNYVAIG